jgi:hypothetical protein
VIIINANPPQPPPNPIAQGLPTNNECKALAGMYITLVLAAIVRLLATDDAPTVDVDNGHTTPTSATWGDIHNLAEQVGQATTPEAKAYQVKLTCAALLVKMKEQR